MKITDIKPAVKNPHRVNIFVDGRYDFSLDLAQVVDFRLKVGSNVTNEQLEEYRKASEFGKLYQRSLEYVLRRPRSIKELRDHLRLTRRKRQVKNRLSEQKLPLFSDCDIENVIERLKQKGYLDDEKFAKYYVENYHVSQGISYRRLVEELRKKGLSTEQIQQATSEYSRDEDEEIKKIIRRKRNKYDDDKLTAYLVRQGFSYQKIVAVLSEMD